MLPQIAAAASARIAPPVDGSSEWREDKHNLSRNSNT
jgi:hypothetical protein